MVSGKGKALGISAALLAAVALASCTYSYETPGGGTRVGAADEIVPVTAAAVAPLPAGNTGAAAVHVVRKADTVYSVSRRYGLPLDALVAANGLKPPYRLAIGQRLALPTQNDPAQNHHVVAKGDTVYSVSRRYGVPIEALAARNDLKPPYRLAIGQRLALPGQSGHVVAKGETVYGISRTYDLPLRALIDRNALKPPYSLAVGQRLDLPVLRRHMVARGETVYGISRHYGVDLTEFVRLNKIAAPYAINPGDRLALPGASARRALSDSIPAGKNVAPAPRQQARRAVPKAIPTPPPRAASRFLWPVKGPVLISFGAKKNGLHNDGINIRAPRGAPVRAAENGVVAYAGNELRGFGNLVLIKHAGGWVTAYAHNDKVLVRRGDTVRRGQTIGRVGSTGNVSTPQLHFEVRKGTRAVDPTRLMASQTAAGGG